MVLMMTCLLSKQSQAPTITQMLSATRFNSVKKLKHGIHLPDLLITLNTLSAGYRRDLRNSITFSNLDWRRGHVAVGQTRENGQPTQIDSWHKTIHLKNWVTLYRLDRRLALGELWRGNDFGIRWPNATNLHRSAAANSFNGIKGLFPRLGFVDALVG